MKSNYEKILLFHTVLFVLRSGLILLFKKEERENTQQEKKVHIDIDDDDNDNQIINHINNFTSATRQ